jgi:putative tryptophan/tyrosine transport system substrate-binding protein
VSRATSDGLFAAAARQRADALLVFAHGFAVLNRGRIIELAARQRLPAMYGYREFVDAGGLMAYRPTFRAWIGEQRATSIAS